MEYTLSLALVDFLPVTFTAIGLYYIVRMVAHINLLQGRVAALGAVLTVAGGFFKAVWKLLMASSSGAIDINWMEDGLFVFMAPGYTLLAFSVWQTVRSVRGMKTFHEWMAPIIFIVLSIYVQPDISRMGARLAQRDGTCHDRYGYSVDRLWLSSENAIGRLALYP